MNKETLNNREYLIEKITADDLLDEDCLAAVSSEQNTVGQSGGVPGIIPVGFSQVMDERILQYDISSFVPYQEYKRQIQDKNTLRRVFTSILDTYETAAAYLLDTTYFFLKEEYIYVDPRDKRSWVILLPVRKKDQEPAEPDFLALFRDMMTGILLGEDMQFYGEVFYELNNMETFNSVRFRELLSGSVGRREDGMVGGTNKNPEEKAENKVVKRGTIEIPDAAEEEEVPPRLGGGKLESSSDGKTFNRFLSNIFGGGKSGNAGSKKAAPAVEKKLADRKADKGWGGGIALPDDEEVLDNMRSSEDQDVPELVIGARRVEKPKKEAKVPIKKESIIKKETPVKKEEPVKQDVPREQSEGMKPQSVDIQPQQPKGENKGAYVGPAAVKGDKIAALMREYGNIDLMYLKDSTGKMILIDRIPFEIGRQGRDLVIAPNKEKASRQHARIEIKDGVYQVVDISSNGTFLDGKRINKREQTPLSNGQKILFKEDEYEIIIIKR